MIVGVWLTFKGAQTAFFASFEAMQLNLAMVMSPQFYAASPMASHVSL